MNRINVLEARVRGAQNRHLKATDEVCRELLAGDLQRATDELDLEIERRRKKIAELVSETENDAIQLTLIYKGLARPTKIEGDEKTIDGKPVTGYRYVAANYGNIPVSLVVYEANRLRTNGVNVKIEVICADGRLVTPWFSDLDIQDECITQFDIKQISRFHLWLTTASVHQSNLTDPRAKGVAAWLADLDALGDNSIYEKEFVPEDLYEEYEKTAELYGEVASDVLFWGQIRETMYSRIISKQDGMYYVRLKRRSEDQN